MPAAKQHSPVRTYSSVNAFVRGVRSGKIPSRGLTARADDDRVVFERKLARADVHVAISEGLIDDSFSPKHDRFEVATFDVAEVLQALAKETRFGAKFV